MTRPSLDLTDARLRRSAGAGALIYVAAFVASILIIGQPVVHEGQEGIEHSLVEGELAPAFIGMYVLTLGFLALLPAMLFLSRALGQRSALGSWAAQTAAAAGTAYVVVIVGVGFSAGAAALWALHQDLDLPSVLALNNVRNFAYFVAVPFMGLYSIALGIAAISDCVLTRWVGWGGVIVGVALLLAIPAAAVGVQYAMPLWLLWWIGNGVVLLRHRGQIDTYESANPDNLGKVDTDDSPLEPSMRHD